MFIVKIQQNTFEIDFLSNQTFEIAKSVHRIKLIPLMESTWKVCHFRLEFVWLCVLDDFYFQTWPFLI